MFKSLLNTFIQSSCSLCQRQTEAIICRYCQKKVESNRLLLEKTDKKTNLPIFAWGKYEGALTRAIAQLKYKNQPQLGTVLGEWLGQSWLDSPHSKKIPKKLTVVPIPLHQQKLKQRGFNQSTKIAQGFCQVTGYKLKPQILIKVKNTEAMFALNPQQRQANIKNALVVNQNFNAIARKSPLLILDDIYTTGSTIQAANMALSQSSIDVYGAAVVAIAITGKS